MYKIRKHPWRSAGIALSLAALGGGTLVTAGPGADAATGHRSGKPAFPVTLRAVNGTVTLSSRPKSIVSLSPTATTMLYAIGAGPQVKAATKDSNYPKGAPATKLTGLVPNVESIAAYHPNLVVLEDDTSSLNTELEKLRIPVLQEPTASDLTQEYRQFDQLGEATGHERAARGEVSKLKAEISRIVKRTPHVHHESYYYELTSKTHYSATSGTFIGRILGLLGLRSIADSAHGAAADDGYPPLGVEYILHADPDYIFLADGQSSATVAARPGWSALGAVRHHRVLELNADIASQWGPRIVDLLRQVAHDLHAHPVSKV